MNYYPFHLGDYAAHTAHLEPMEDLAYRRMLDLYYRTEKPLSADLKELGRLIRLRGMEDVLECVLSEFFTLQDDGWHSCRCDEEISRMLEKQAKAKASADARWSKTEKPSNADGMRTHSDGNAEAMLPTPTPTPTPNVDTGCYASLSAAVLPTDPEDAETVEMPPGFPDCPHAELLALYRKHLPHLAQPRSWTGNRAAQLRNRWRDAGRKSAYSKGYATHDDGIRWWDSFFGYIANDTKLPNGFESKERSWRPDIEWIAKAANFQKIIDGKYDK